MVRSYGNFIIIRAVNLPPYERSDKITGTKYLISD